MFFSPASRNTSGRLTVQLRRIASSCVAFALPWVAQAAPGDLEAIGVTPTGVPANGWSEPMDVSEDGRYVVFNAEDSGIVAGDTNGKADLFVRDRQTGVTKRLTISASGRQANADTYLARITPDGRYVVFSTAASNLVANDTSAGTSDSDSDVFIYDQQTGALQLVSLGPNGQQPNEGSSHASVSDDGRFVAFPAQGTNVGLPIPGPDDSPSGVYVRDRQSGTTQLVSVNSAGIPSNGSIGECDISGNGRYVAFVSYGSNLAPNDTNGKADVFVRDRQMGVTERVSLMPNGAQFATTATLPAISSDGRYVAFMEDNSFIWVRDRWTGTTEPVSVSSTETLANRSSYRPAISADGRYVVFESFATNLVAGDTNNNMDVFRRDRVAGITQIVSRDYQNNPALGLSLFASISPDGNFVGFGSDARLVPGDTDNEFDAYLAEVGAEGLYAFTIKPKALSFGSQTLLTSRTQTFWLRNTGGRILPIESVSLVGENSRQFSLANGCGSSLAIGKACPIKVTFTPTWLGNKTAWVRVIAADHVIRRRAVYGTGITAAP